MHTPVLLHEVVDGLAVKDGGLYLDGTLGLGGHAEAILARRECSLLGLDRDRTALRYAMGRLSPFGLRAHAQHASFADFAVHMDALGWDRLDGALLDIGVSSMQLDRGERGFSYRLDARLDMRMDQEADVPTACDIVNTWDADRLREAIARFGEEPNAARIVSRIVTARKKGGIRTTGELASLVEAAYPAAWRAKARHHPATRTFQALRILVNDELGQLNRFLEQILGRMQTGGRLLIITFHSLEDRLVKQTMHRWAKACLCPPSARTCVCGHKPEAVLLWKKPLVASPEECAINPRATSAKLRAVEKLAGQ
ncbi:MAG: 16S rRNA (cytosine(1402)-N(4))-methyltransferase RsmH [Desulfovibrionaceae bacterium]|nr:16S rRNA (cytosine(1402)-N(4))-methyltransferase RsmH [Desulfovibrionaceae bacterium]